jgi:hypothetical protein
LCLRRLTRLTTTRMTTDAEPVLSDAADAELLRYEASSA